MATASERDQSKFDDLLRDLSKKDYPGNKSNWLRCLLYDNLKIGELSHKSGLQFFSKLQEGNNISYNNVEILLEIAELTGQHAAKMRINEYKKAMGDRYDGNTGPRLTEYRKALYKSLREVGPDELPDVVAFYHVDHEGFTNIWDCVFHLEKTMELNDTPEKIKRFGKLLNPTARSVLDKLGDRPRPMPGTPGRPVIPKDKTTSKQELPSTSTAIPQKDFNALLIRVSQWYNSKGHTNMLKLLFSDLLDRRVVRSSANPKKLFDTFVQKRRLSRTDLTILVDMIKVTDTRQILDDETKLRDAFTEDKITSFFPYRQKLIRLGCSLDGDDISGFADLYGVGPTEYSDIWTLIMVLEDRGKISKNDHGFKSLIQDLESIMLDHAVQALK